MLRNIVIAFAAIALAAAPAAAQRVGYQPANMWGGYKDKETKPGIYRVVAKLNAWSGGARRAYAMAHYRAAEIMAGKEFTHFRILKMKSSELVMQGSTPTGSNFGKTHLWVRGASGADDVEGCDMKGKKADRCVTLSVSETMALYRKQLDFEKY
ncbi:hypothetical protein QWY75_09150 [Pontixanthobacter aestiaquae]|uniref:DUF3757 domain-containing protein n=1 Tax=Pontixanthobacter aestiaquae TaxID=1509367 RepID=A0A844Z6E4_9SPHN|nr:hypothetical protein [Pontixanthobacter aestiaquae]MDN3646364.1 hypothetical protein [Pontixanthobacter aestiaquae]MXO82647.1 hypothetical protein [Pontixanthobacter aestiaquae]